MTREEAIKYLRQIYPNGGHCWLDAQRIEALDMAIQALSVSLPEGLDEAEQKYVETCECPPANQEEERMVYEAYKAGWAARDAQFSKLLGDMDEAAEDIFHKKFPSYTNCHQLTKREMLELIKAGEELMKAKMMEDALDARVYVVESIPQDCSYVGFETDAPAYYARLKDGDKVKLIIVKEEEK